MIAAHRRTNIEGLELLGSPARFSLEVPAAAVLDSVWRGVRAQDRAPLAVIAETYRAERSADAVVWRYGNRVSTSFVAALVTTERDGRTEAELRFREAREVNGVIEGVAVMRALRHDVERTLALLAPTEG